MGWRRLLLVFVVTSGVGCGGTLTPGQTRFSLDQETEVIILESGTIIYGKREVARFQDGKIVDGFGGVLAFLNEDSLRLRGGAALRLRTDGDGALYVSEKEQREAGLTPVTYRVRPDGRLARSAGAGGIEIKGAGSAAKRRLVLAILVLIENQLVTIAEPEEPPSMEL